LNLRAPTPRQGGLNTMTMERVARTSTWLAHGNGQGWRPALALLALLRKMSCDV
jgi:hypothetical protein